MSTQGSGTPSHPPPGYGYPPPHWSPPPGAWPPPTNTTAVLALVMAFVAAPAGLVLGIVARRQIQRTGEGGAGLALAGIIVGGIFTAVYVLMIVFWIVAFVMLRNASFGP